MVLLNSTHFDVDQIEGVLFRTLQYARNRTDACQACAVQRTEVSVQIQYGRIHRVEFSNDTRLKITIFRAQRRGIAVSNSFRDTDARTIVDAAVSSSRATSKDSSFGLPEKSLLAFDAPRLNLFHPVVMDFEDCVRLLLFVEQSAFRINPCIRKTTGSTFVGRYCAYGVGNTNGLLKTYTKSLYSMDCSVVAERFGSMEENSSHTIGCDFVDLRSPQWVGRRAAERALAHLNPQKVHTSNVPVVFSSEVAASLFYCLVRAIDGYNVHRRSTFLLGMLNRTVFPRWLSVEEHPHLEKQHNSSPFDDEGVQTKKICVVENGVLRSWLLDCYSGRKLGFSSNGHAGKICTWKVSHQSMKRNDLIEKMEEGILVTNVMGQGINIATGVYSQGISGYWVGKGKVQFPVKETTIAGNLKNMFSSILNISNDVETRDRIQCGSVLVSSMTVSAR